MITTMPVNGHPWTNVLLIIVWTVGGVLVSTVYWDQLAKINLGLAIPSCFLGIGSENSVETSVEFMIDYYNSNIVAWSILV